MPFLDPLKRKLTISELQERNDELKIQEDNEKLQLSIEQQRMLRQKLKANGLNVGMFGSVGKAWEWFKKH